MPNGMNFETDCGESAEPAAPLWCPDSPEQMCRMMCGEPEACANAGECNMRQGSCCDTQCVTFVEGGSAEPEVCEQGADCGGQIPNECGSSCPATCGAPVGMCNMMCNNGFFCPSGQAFHVDAGECRQIVNQATMECRGPCTQGDDCGGQVWNTCASSCPAICGYPGPMMCNMMCNQKYECPFGQCFDEQTGTCEDSRNYPSGLPPGIAPGRPFLAAMAAKEEDYPTAEFSVLAGAVEMPSDWNEEL